MSGHDDDERSELAAQVREAALRASESRLRKLVQSANDAVVVMDAAGIVVDWNPRAEIMFGWSAAEALGERLSDMIVPPALRERHESGVRRYLSSRQSRLIGRSVEVAAVTRDGREIPVELSLWPLESDRTILFGAFIRDISQRRAAEAALRNQEEKYRSVVDNVSEGILVVHEGHIVFANPSTERIVGMTLAMMREVPFTHSIHPDDRALVADRHMRRLRGEEVEQHYAFRIVRADARVVWLELSAVQMMWDGKPATLSFITDITERKGLQDQLRQSLIERETILENSIVGILFLDPQRCVRWANTALSQMFGMERDRAIGMSAEHFYPSHEAYVAAGAQVAEAVARGRGFETELEMRRANGESFWAYISGRAVDRSDLLQGTVWAMIDITERKQLEQALQRKTDEQEAILQSTLIGISLIAGGRFQWINRTLAEMFGYRPGELIGSEAARLFTDPAAWAEFEPAMRVNLEGQGHYSGEHPLGRRDGTTVWVQLHGTRIDPRDGTRGSLWTFVDVTERRRAEEETQRALQKEKELNQLKSRFVSMTSHEFRTPLAGILSSIELLRHYGARLEDEEKVELFQQVEEAVERMTRMLDNILLIGRADARGLQFRPASIDLVALCRELAEEVTRSRSGGGDRPVLDLRVDGVAAEYVLDPVLLRHILGNLLSNAFKYSPAGGNVQFEIAADGAQLRFVVADQGIGIPPADQQRLFESFHRASNVGNIAGTGLGLAIVKQSVDLHGGTIELDSAPGRGSRFTVSLPIAAG